MPKDNWKKLLKSNDDYHNAVNGILEDKSLAVNTKTEFAALAKEVFRFMATAEAVIKPHYEPEEEPEEEAGGK